MIRPIPGDILARMLAVASDGEAAMLDDLAERAGVVWNCRDDEGSSHWTNRDTDAACCRCGKPKP